MTSTVLGGRYELRQQLGRGGMATVHEAYDDLLDRAVAIKLLRVDTTGNARLRFDAEARNAASLMHPHAVAVYDVNTSGDQPYIVMELVRGETVEDVLEREQAMPAEQVIAVGAQVLSALHAAHRRGLIHRDVKPANILLPDGEVPTRADQLPGVKLADFGIAKAVRDATDGLTLAGQVIGTPKYLSPEQVQGETATPRSDIYATGVVLYEMLAGKPPFERDTAVALALAHRQDEPPPLRSIVPDVDPALAALVHRALAKDPGARFADAEAMRAALLDLGGRPGGTQLLPTPDEHTARVDRAAAVPPVGVGAAGTARTTRPPGGQTPQHAARARTRTPWTLVVILLLALAAWLAIPRVLDSIAPTNDPTIAPEQPAGGAGDPDPNGAAQPEPAAPEAEEPDPADNDPAEPEPEPEEPAPAEPDPDDSPAVEPDPEPTP